MAFDIGALLGRMKLSKQGFSAGLLSAEKDLKGFTTKGSSHMKLLGGAILAVTGVVSGLVGTLAGIVIKTANYGDEMEKLSRRTGMAVETLSALAYAADLEDASFQDLQTGIRGLVAAMNTARQGSKETAFAFAELGVDFLDAQGNLRPTEEMFFDLAEALKNMENETEAVALAQIVFGRSAMTLVPLLRNGKIGIQEMMAEGKKLGVVFDSQMAASSAAFNDSLTRVKASLMGVVYMVGGPMIEELQPMLDELAKWVVANKELIAQDIVFLVRGFAEEAKLAAKAIMATVDAVISLVQAAKDLAKWAGEQPRRASEKMSFMQIPGWNATEAKSMDQQLQSWTQHCADMRAVNSQAVDQMVQKRLDLASTFADAGRISAVANLEVNATQKMEINVKHDITEPAIDQCKREIAEPIAKAITVSEADFAKGLKLGISRSVDQGLMGR